jgi:hypothetical protein
MTDRPREQSEREREAARERETVRREAEDEPLDVRTVELDDEDGNKVVIAQQNVGPDNQVGEGEFKPPGPPKDPRAAADEQADIRERT